MVLISISLMTPFNGLVGHACVSGEMSVKSLARFSTGSSYCSVVSVILFFDTDRFSEI